MKLNKELLIASINIILITTLIALASSCTTQEKMVGNYYNHSNKYRFFFDEDYDYVENVKLENKLNEIYSDR